MDIRDRIKSLTCFDSSRGIADFGFGLYFVYEGEKCAVAVNGGFTENPFSVGMRGLIGNYFSRQQKYVRYPFSRSEYVRDLYKDLSDQLTIEAYAYRDFSEGKRKVRQGFAGFNFLLGRHEVNRGGIETFFLPLSIPLGFKDLVKEVFHQSGKARKLANKKGLYRQTGADFVGVGFNRDGIGDADAERFTSLDFYLQNGIRIRPNLAERVTDGFCYNDAVWFVRLDHEIANLVDRNLAEEEAEIENGKAILDALKNPEQQKILLEHVISAK